MKKITYKSIAILILISSILMLILVGNINLSDYVKNIIITISINLISSVLIIYMIDFKREDYMQIEIEERRKIILRQLILPLKIFDSHVLNMYKSVTTYDEMKNLEYNIENVDNIIEKIKLIDNDKYSYSYSSDLHREIWKETIVKQSFDLVEKIENFYNQNLNFLSNDLTDNILTALSTNSNRFIFDTLLQKNTTIKTEDLLKTLNFRELLTASFKIKEEILKYYQEDLFEINKDKLLNDEINPHFMSGI